MRKYPALFLRAAAVIINKIDLLGFMDYDIERVKADFRAHNSRVKVFETSAKTGEGLEQWFCFIKEQRRYILVWLTVKGIPGLAPKISARHLFF